MTMTSDDVGGTRTTYMTRDRYGMYAGTASGGGEGPGPRLMGADTLIGNDVYNRADESLGDIKEIMLDMQSGKVAYAVLAFGGFLGMGEKLFAVPWNALTLDTANHCFRLDVDRDRLKDAPGFDKDHWPDMADPTWGRGVHDFYGSRYFDDDVPASGMGAASGSYDATQPNDRIGTTSAGSTVI